MQPSSPNFCSITRLWLPRSTVAHTSAVSDFGGALTRLFARSKTHLRSRLLLIAGILVAVIHLASLSSTLLFSTEASLTWLPWVLFSTSLVFSLGLFLPLSLKAGCSARDGFWGRLFHIDTWMGFCVLMGFAENFIFVGSDFSIEFSLPLTFLPMGILTVAVILWTLLRWLDARSWGSHLKDSFSETESLWSGGGLPYTALKRHQSFLMILGLGLLSVILAILYFQMNVLLKPSVIMGTFLPLTVPYGQTLLTQLMSRSEALYFRCRHFKSFLSLRNIRFVILHKMGVLTRHDQKVAEIWIDEAHDWSKDEIHEILHSLCRASQHPLARLILNFLKAPKRPLITVNHLSITQNLGIEATLTDIKGAGLTAQWGRPTWHKLLQHEMDRVGLTKLKDWSQKGYVISLLALNRQVVCAIAVSTEERENIMNALEGLQSLGVARAVMTSSSVAANSRLSVLLNDYAEDVLPVERLPQLNHWLELESQALEVRAPWDPPSLPDNLGISFATGGEESGDLVLSEEAPLDSVPQILKWSRQYHRWSNGILPIAVLTSLVALATEQLSASILLAATLWALWNLCIRRLR